MTSFLHAHPWLLFFGALFVLFLLNAAVCWALARAAALGDRVRVLPPAQWAGEDRAPLASSSARADEWMREFDAELERVVWEWSR